jgi:hypothetical protein
MYGVDLTRSQWYWSEFEWMKYEQLALAGRELETLVTQLAARVGVV